jgi:HAE1 family hydrophobic/amphiphilic exporter-1
VPDLPEEATRPVAEAVSSDTSQPIMWIGLRAKDRVADPAAHVNRMRALVDDVIEPRLRRVSGVGSLIVAGGQEREIRIVVDLHRLAQRRIPLTEVIRVVRQSHLTVRGGPLEAGKREYVVWTKGRQNTLTSVGNIVLARTRQGVVRIHDVARVVAGHKRAQTIMRQNGEGAIALGVLRKTGANVPATARRVVQAVAEINRDFEQRDLPYHMKVMYTEVTYIDDAISLVTLNLLIGSGLAVLVLLLFLGSIRSVLVIGISIPVSLITVFIVLEAAGRSMNIVSLAGLAFAVGMVVDNAIVVLENIFRKLTEGAPPEEAAYHGTREVALAVAASTVTTVAVFLPVVFLQSEAGQIFKDIAIAIACAVIFSLVSSLTLIPMLSRLLLRRPSEPKHRLNPHALVRGAGEWAESVYYRFLGGVVGRGHGPVRAAVVIAVLSVFLASLAWLPPSEYLPSGNRRLIITLAEPLPGTRLEQTSEAIRPLERFLLDQPETERIFTVFSPRFTAVGCVLKKEHGHEEELEQMLQRIRRKVGSLAGFRYLFPIKASIFRVPGKQFEVELRGPELERLAKLSRLLSGRLRAVEGVVGVRSDFEGGALNLEVIPDRASLSEQGLTPAQLADAVQVALGGLKVGAFLDRGREIDLTLIGPQNYFQSPGALEALPLATARPGGSPGSGSGPANSIHAAAAGRAPGGGASLGRNVTYLSNLAKVRTERSPTEIHRVEMQRAVTLTVNLSRDAALGEVMDRVEAQVLSPLRRALPSAYQLKLGETANRLQETLDELSGSFLLAVLISYLLMVALFRSFGYPLIILTSVPMGATGAFLFVSITGVSFDTITMLGLIILAGIVVNNAILVVHQSLRLRREGLPFEEALRQGAVSRLRPIVMTVTTSVLGMMPLALGTGPGAELYKGLGIAIVGGLTLSTMVTLLLVPTLMAIAHDLGRALLPRREHTDETTSRPMFGPR